MAHLTMTNIFLPNATETYNEPAISRCRPRWSATSSSSWWRGGGERPFGTQPWPSLGSAIALALTKTDTLLTRALMGFFIGEPDLSASGRARADTAPGSPRSVRRQPSNREVCRTCRDKSPLRRHGLAGESSSNIVAPAVPDKPPVAVAGSASASYAVYLDSRCPSSGRVALTISAADDFHAALYLPTVLADAGGGGSVGGLCLSSHRTSGAALGAVAIAGKEHAAAVVGGQTARSEAGAQ